jgi:hypothetical protein
MSKRSSGQAQLVERQRNLDAASEHLLSASTDADESKRPANQAEEAAKILRLITQQRLDDFKEFQGKQNNLRAFLSYLMHSVKAG